MITWPSQSHLSSWINATCSGTIFEKSTCSFDHCSPLLSICTGLEMIIFTTFCDGESGNKSIKAWLPSKDCVRLGSSGIEPTLQKRKKLFSQDLKARYRCKSLWKLTDLNVILNISNHWEFSAICYYNNNDDWQTISVLLCNKLDTTRIWLTFLRLPANDTFAFPYILYTSLLIFYFQFYMSCIKTRQQCNKWWKIKTIFHKTWTICP